MPVLHCLNAESKQEYHFDIIFIHGLCSDYRNSFKHAFTTWGGVNKDSDFWPKWINSHFKKSRVWVLEYEASAFSFFRNNLEVEDLSNLIMGSFLANNIGKKPVIFICHSLGGILIKQIIQDAFLSNHRDWNDLVSNLRGIVFLGTPHSGARLASSILKISFLTLVGVSVIVRSLTHSNAHLRKIGDWYRDNSQQLGIDTLSFYETKRTFFAHVVDAVTAKSGVINERLFPVQKDHFHIAKLTSIECDQFKIIVKFIEEVIRPFG